MRGSTGPHRPTHAVRVDGHSELRAAALLKAVWRDLRLASLLAHLFVCLLFEWYGYGFLSGGKARGVTYCMLVGLLSGHVFSPFGEVWLAGSHRGGITFRDVCGH